MSRSLINSLLLFCLFCCQTVLQGIGQEMPSRDRLSREKTDCPPGSDCTVKAKPKIALPDESITVTTTFQDGAVQLETTMTVVDMEKFKSSGSVDRIEDVLKQMSGIDVIQGQEARILNKSL